MSCQALCWVDLAGEVGVHGPKAMRELERNDDKASIVRPQISSVRNAERSEALEPGVVHVSLMTPGSDFFSTERFEQERDCMATKVATKAKVEAPRHNAQSTALARKANQGELIVLSEEDAVVGAAKGFEKVTVRDLMIPRLTILQGLSPQIMKSKPEYVKGSEIGDFCDTATGDLFKSAIEIIPCFFATVFLEWAPRSSGKGLVRNWGTDSSGFDAVVPDEKGKRFTESGSYIQETATWYCLNVNADFRPSFIPLASTQLKASRRWNTALGNQRHTKPDGSLVKPSMWYRSWNASPVEQSNNDGTWFLWKFEAGRRTFEIDPSGALWKACQNFYEQASQGLVKGDVTQMEIDGESTDSAGGVM